MTPIALSEEAPRASSVELAAFGMGGLRDPDAPTALVGRPLVDTFP